MGETHRLAPAVGADGDQAVAFELLQDREAGGGLELAEADGLAQRQQLEHVAGRRVEPADARLDHLAETGRGAERPVQAPHAVALDEELPRPRSEHQLPQRQARSPGWPPTARPTRRASRGPSNATCNNVSTPSWSSSPRSIRVARSSRHHRVTVSGTA